MRRNGWYLMANSLPYALGNVTLILNCLFSVSICCDVEMFHKSLELLKMVNVNLFFLITLLCRYSSWDTTLPQLIPGGSPGNYFYKCDFKLWIRLSIEHKLKENSVFIPSIFLVMTNTWVCLPGLVECNRLVCYLNWQGS